MAANNQLFQLIQSLTRAEKGYFKKYCTRYATDNNSNYLRLFAAIEKQQRYDEQALLKAFEGERFIRQFSVAKNYLYKMVMKSLRSYNSELSLDVQLSELMINVEVLFRKGLTDLCAKELRKATRLVKRYEVFHKYAEIAKWEKYLYGFNAYSLSMEKRIEGIYEEEISSAQKLVNVTEYARLSYQLFNKSMKEGMTRDVEALKEYDAILRHPLMDGEYLAESVMAKCHFNNIMAKYYEVHNDYENFHEYNKRFVDTLESNPDHLTTNMRGYIHSVYNLLLSNVVLRNVNDFNEVLKKFDAIPEVHRKHCTDNLSEAVPVLSLNARIYFLLILGKFKEALELTEPIIAMIQKGVNPQYQITFVELSYFLAYTYFGNGDYRASIRWLNQLINEPYADLREDLFCYARILNLINHFELENDILVQYNLKSTYRYLAKMKKVHRFEEVMLSFLKTLLRTSDQIELKKELVVLKADLSAIATDPFEHNAFDHFDFISWIDSKLERKTFAAMVMRNQQL